MSSLISLRIPIYLPISLKISIYLPISLSISIYPHISLRIPFNPPISLSIPDEPPCYVKQCYGLVIFIYVSFNYLEVFAVYKTTLTQLLTCWVLTFY